MRLRSANGSVVNVSDEKGARLLLMGYEPVEQPARRARTSRKESKK